MDDEQLEIKFEINKNDHLITGISEIITVSFDGEWIVTGGNPNWIGKSHSRDLAVLEWLKCRLGYYAA